ncbi:ABC transporter substrate-binding protein [Actinomadura graeca]|uniref:ABC transporter substrate-binding protein n=1 Tax=Actinomadura graeca TaxID=2750812 RepID=A0ABX8QX50_9ACTN|nr:ABC transporter substrate-binding protein [Actinomadura graeca]QXJ22554.1 ABC transporter substrate-binding protein [Actinomadura graeca]
MPIGLTACGSAAQGPAKTAKPNEDKPLKLKVGALPVVGNVPLFLAQEKGFFREEGLDVEISTDVSNPANAVPAVLSGDLDLITSNSVTFLQAVGKRLPVTFVSAVSSNSPEYTGTYVKKDSPIRTIKDLAGKKVGLLALGGIQHVAYLKAAKDSGIDPGSVTFVELPIQNTVSALESGKVDAAGLIEPFITIGGSGLRRIASGLDEGLGPQTLVTGMMTSNKFVKANPDAAGGFARAMARAETYCADHPGDVRATLGKVSKTPPAVLAKIGMPTFHKGSDAASLRQQLRRQAQVMVDVGRLKQMPDVDGSVFGG